MGCDGIWSPYWHRRCISIHAPQWGATFSSSLTESGVEEFQSTHPSGVRLTKMEAGGVYADISIHAPQWGATKIHRQPEQGRAISIHAPQWGATRGRGWPWWPSCDFNPRTPVGCDLLQRLHALPGGISIHAPQWGATPHHQPGTTKLRISIHAPQWGATPLLLGMVITAQFQSTHPSGVRLLQCRRDSPRLTISIHAPQWGATWRQGS